MLQRKDVRAGRLASWLAAVGVVAGAVGACVELRGSLGSDCLKNQDCQSGVCSQLRCVAAPPLLDAEPGPDAGADAPLDGPVVTPPDDSGTPGLDATEPPDAKPEMDVITPDSGPSPIDAPADAIEDSSSPDAPNDAPADARQDAGESG